MDGSPTIAFAGTERAGFVRELLIGILGVPELAEARVRLHDANPERLATAEAITNRVAGQHDARPKVSVHAELGAAIDGADFVVTAVDVGGRAAARVDLEVPAGFGLRQTVADTLGVGGIFRFLRTAPALDAIAAAVHERCPDAWLLHHANPLAMNLTYLGARHPQVRALGLCHSAYRTVAGLNELVGAPLEGTTYEAVGVNQQAWLLRWEHRGASLYPELDAQIAADPALRRRVPVDLYLRLGYYPTGSSVHAGEYLPWYLRHDAEIDRLQIPIGDGEPVDADGADEYDGARDEPVADLLLPPPEATGYTGQVIQAMSGGQARTIHANVPNRGLVPNLPLGLPVEVPTVVDAEGVHPAAQQPLPPACAALNRTYLSVVHLTTQAALSEDPRLLRQAVMLDPNTAASLTLPQIDELVPAMIRAHGDLMPPWLAARA